MDHKSDEPKRWLRIEQAAEYAHTTPGFIKAQIRAHKLPFRKGANVS